ncbi:MAG: histidine kinase [Bacteroidales bacterium]|nr:histidine kinase [Bacteroidales bacterium]
MIIINIKRAKFFWITLVIVLIITTGTIISYLLNGPELFSSFPYYFKITSYGFLLGFGFWLGHWAISTYTENKLDWTKNLKRANVISLNLYICYGIIFSLPVTYLYSVHVFEVTGEDLVLDVLIKFLMIMFIDLMVISSYYSTYLTKYWKKAIENNEELKRENLLAKYEVLKNKVNPHFLFNSLNTLSSVIERKPELGSDFVKKLSDIYRYVLEQSDKELVSLDTEMKFVEDYIFLSKIRFGDALTFHSAIPENTNIKVVPLGLQTLVENVIKHNIISDDMPLQIDVGIEDDFIVLKNNIQKKNIIIPDRKPHGLENLKKRYAYHTDSLIGITESDELFLVRLPIIKTKSHELLDY